MGKLGTIAEISVILTAPFAIIAALPQLGIEKLYPALQNNPYVAPTAFLSLMSLITVGIIAIATFGGQFGVSVMMRFNDKMLEANILRRSRIEVGGFMDIEGRFTGDLQNGYLSFVVITPFGTIEKSGYSIMKKQN